MSVRLEVPRRPLGRTGLDVSVLGYGSVPIGQPGYPYEDAAELLDGILAAGVNLIDTAAAYGRAESVIGRALHSRRDELVLVTKTGAVENYAPAWSKPEIRQTIDRSLERLQTEVVDVVLLHTCEQSLLEQGEVVEAVQEAKAAGKTRFIGYSGDNDALTYALDLGVFDVVEASYSLLDQVNRETLRRAEREGVGVLLKRPLANAVPGRSEPPPSPYAAAYWPRWSAIGLEPEDVGGVPWLEAAARFSAYADGVSAMLSGSGSLEHLLANIQAVNAGPLPEEHVKRIEARFDAHADEWPGLT
ncbi:MAG: aldo/keto reductase [Planctomycetota bacterium]|nr:aldo/keto reductase [Planctomycetota bacterium]